MIIAGTARVQSLEKYDITPRHMNNVVLRCPHGHTARRKCDTCGREDDQAEIAQLRCTLSLAEEGLANYEEEMERLTLHKDVAQKHIDALTNRYERLRVALENIADLAATKPLMRSDLVRLCEVALDSSREPQSAEHT